MEDKCSLCKGDKLADLVYGDSLGLCVNCRIEIKAAERRGAERMLSLFPGAEESCPQIWEVWEKLPSPTPEVKS